LQWWAYTPFFFAKPKEVVGTMADRVKILAFAGSTREGSYNKKLIRVAAEGARNAGAEVTLVDLRDFPLPLYDGDLETRDGLPENGQALRALFLAHQGLLISTPEYNGSVPGVLKNTIDWLSRPVEGAKPLDCFDGKVAGLVAASPGSLGGLRSLAHLRQILAGIRVLVLPQQQAVPRANNAFDKTDALKDETMRERVVAIGARLAEVTAKLV